MCGTSHLGQVSSALGLLSSLDLCRHLAVKVNLDQGLDLVPVLECGGSGLETEVFAIAPQVASGGCLDDVGSWCAHPAHCCRLLPSLLPLTLDEDWIPGLEDEVW